jgi:hypothetical protein
VSKLNLSRSKFPPLAPFARPASQETVFPKEFGFQLAVYGGNKEPEEVIRGKVDRIAMLHLPGMGASGRQHRFNFSQSHFPGGR